jgi:hypothetical protein
MSSVREVEMNLSTSPGTLGFEQVTDDIDSIPGTRWLVVDARVQHITLRQVLDEACAALRCLDGDEIWRTTPCCSNHSLARSLRSAFLPGNARSKRWWQWDCYRSADGAHRQCSLLFDVVDRVAFRLLANAAIPGFLRTFAPAVFPSSRLSTLAHIANLSIEAAAEAEQLRFKLSERLARDAIELSNKALGLDANTSLLPTCVLAQLAYESGAIEEADQLIRRRMAMIEQCGSVDTALLGFVCIGKCCPGARQPGRRSSDPSARRRDRASPWMVSVGSSMRGRAGFFFTFCPSDWMRPRRR